MTFATFVALAMLSTTAAQSAPQTDPITALVQQLEAAAKAGNREAIRAVGVDLTITSDLAFALTSPPPSEIVIRELQSGQERSVTGLPPGALYTYWQNGLAWDRTGQRLAISWTASRTNPNVFLDSGTHADAVQLTEASGLGLSQRQLTERLYRDAAVVALVGEGNDLLRSVIAGSILGLG